MRHIPTATRRDLERSFRHRTCGQPIADAKLLTATVMRAVAAGIQKGLHRIARRVGQLNALRVFLDTPKATAEPLGDVATNDG